MKPIRLQIHDFMNHVNSDIDCTLFKSALIVAKNKQNDQESNGIGKTTIYSAIEYVLFGAVPTSVLDKVIRDDAEKCEVIFDFAINDEVYRILRGRSIRGRSELRLWKFENDKWESKTQRTMPETDEKIRKLIKINHKAFIHSIKFAQYDLSGVSSADDPDRRKGILKEPLQLSDYIKLEKISKNKLSFLNKEMEKVITSISVLGNPQNEVLSATNEIKYYETLITTKEAESDKCKASLNEKKLMLEDLRKLINTSDSNIHDKILELQHRSDIINNSIAKQRKLTISIQEQIKNAEELNNSAKKSLDDLSIKKNELISSELRDKTIVNEELNKVLQDELYGTKLLAQYEAEYDAANKRIPSGDFCTQCQQPITEEHKKQCKELILNILAEKSKEIEDIRKNLSKCKNKKAKLQVEINQIIEHERKNSYLLNEYNKIKSNLEIYEKNLTEIKKQEIDSQQELELKQNEHKDILDRLSSLRDSVKNSSFAEINNKILVLTDEIGVYDHTLEAFRKEISNYLSRVGALNEKIKISTDNLNKLNELNIELQKYKDEIEIHEMVVHAFSSSGIPTFIIHTILDELQLEANKMLQNIRPELEIQFDKDVNMYYKVYGREKEYSQLSIGQKIYILFSLKIGLSRIIQRKLGIDIRFIEFDEVDQSLDKAGVTAFSDVLKKLQDEFQIWIITHNETLKERFTHAILVEGNGDQGASARVVTSW